MNNYRNNYGEHLSGEQSVRAAILARIQGIAALPPAALRTEPMSYEPQLQRWLDGEPFVGIEPSDADWAWFYKALADKWIEFKRRYEQLLSVYGTMTHLPGINAEDFAAEVMRAYNETISPIVDSFDSMNGTDAQDNPEGVNMLASGTARCWRDMPQGAEFQSFMHMVNQYFKQVVSVAIKDQKGWLVSTGDWLNEVAKKFGTLIKVVTSAVGTAAAAYAASNLFNGWASGGTTARTSPTAYMSPFIDKDIPNVVTQAFRAADKLEYLDAVVGATRRRAKTARKIIMNNRADRKTAVASFGDIELGLNMPQRDMLVDAAVEAILFDHMLLSNAVNCKPGSMDACMYADMYNMPIMKDPRSHAAMAHRFGDDGDDEYVDDDWNWYSVEEDEPVDEENAAWEEPELGGPPAEPDIFTFKPMALNPEEGGPTNPRADTPEPGFWSTAGEVFKALPGVVKVVKEVFGSNPTPAPSAQVAATRFGSPIGVFTWLNGRVVAIPANSKPEYLQRAEAIINQFLKDPSLVAPGTQSEFAFWTQNPPFPKNSVVRFQDRAVGMGSTTKGVAVPFMSDKPAYLRAEKLTFHDAVCSSTFDRTTPTPDAGVFFKSGMLEAMLTDLPYNTYGQIDVSSMPYRIEINRNYVDSRAKVSFVHETLHAITELLKLGLSHEQLHALSVFVTSEVLPGYLALEAKLSGKQ